MFDINYSDDNLFFLGFIKINRLMLAREIENRTTILLIDTFHDYMSLDLFLRQEPLYADINRNLLYIVIVNFVVLDAFLSWVDFVSNIFVLFELLCNILWIIYDLYDAFLFKLLLQQN